jgi:methionyl-tRNA formyltransferase
VPSLEAVIGAGHEVAALVTKPDREKGRGQQLAAPPVKPVAEAHGITVLQPRKIREEGSVQALRALGPEILVVVAYGEILPKPVLDLAPRGAINVHASLLPRWRGAAPVQWAIAQGDSESGVTTMLLDEGLDTGPILLQHRTPISPEETAAELLPRLAARGAELLVETLAGLALGTVRPVAQEAALATAARILTKEDGRIDWAREATEIACRVRGFLPWPGAFTLFEGRTVKVLRARVEKGGPPGSPGVVTQMGDGILVACGKSTQLRLLSVQPESRRPMPAAAFAQGARLRPGDRFD